MMPTGTASRRKAVPVTQRIVVQRVTRTALPRDRGPLRGDVSFLEDGARTLTVDDSLDHRRLTCPECQPAQRRRRCRVHWDAVLFASCQTSRVLRFLRDAASGIACCSPRRLWRPA